jgi:hypothetical protein
VFVGPTVQGLEKACSVATSLGLTDAANEGQSFVRGGPVLCQGAKRGVGEDDVGGFSNLIRDGLAQCSEMFEERAIDVLPRGFLRLGGLAINFGLRSQERDLDLSTQEW